ncbi:MAG: hypothetical protein LBT29_06780 [Flavobacteriaceae bacterium]|jgi:hypothetical protein|nr:hypothetical protein [Flavobacteriaceae bacterium]
MKKAKYLFLFLLISFILNAQVRFVNQTTRQSVSNVTLLSNDGKIIGGSDIYGNFDIAAVNNEVKITDSDTVEAVHSDFVPQKFIWNDLKTASVGYLTPLKEIKEVVVTGKQKEFLVLKGYFYSYSSVDDSPWAFSDGIVEYYISKDKNKVVDFNIVENRTFENTGLTDSIKRKGIITINIVPDISPLSFRGEWLLMSANRKSIYTQSNNYLLSKNDTIGKIDHNGNNINLSIEYCTPDRPNEFSFFGIHAKTVNHISSESFSSKLTISNIKTISEYEKSYITRKKGGTKKYIEIANFYVLDKKFLSKEEMKKIKFNNSNSVSNYSSHFWENSELPPLPSFITDKLGEKLILSTKNIKNQP